MSNSSSQYRFKTLSYEFNKRLVQYKDMYKNYIDSLENNKNSNFVNIPNSSFTGVNIGTLTNSNIENCETKCYENISCTGATFNNSSNNCLLVSGVGNIIPVNESTAIVTERIFYSQELQNINSQLISINEEIIELNKQQNRQLNNTEYNKYINNNYDILLKERMVIDKLIKQNQTIDSAYENSSLVATSNYYYFIVLLFGVILLVCLLINFSLSSNRLQHGGNSKNSYSLFIIIIILFSINFLFTIYKLLSNNVK